MIRRTVRMTFREDYIETFRQLFFESQDKIKAFDGCLHVELWQDVDNPCCFTTFSLWESVDHLNTYRTSALFAGVWALTKAGFTEKPVALSHNLIEN